MQLGEFEIFPLSDGTFRLDGGAMFGVVPKPLWEKRAPADARNRISLGMRPLLVRTPRDLVLIDAGIGDKMSAKEVEIYGIDRAQHLGHALAAMRVAPEDITLAIASHLHFDHIGGWTERVNGELRPRFPRARHVVRRGEWDDATHPHERNRASYLSDNFLPIEAAGLLEFIDRDGDIVPGISAWKTGGHTAHHQIIKIAGGGRTAVFTADLMPTSAHVDPQWVMGYDLYPMDTFLYKKAFLREAIAGEYVIFFEHDPQLAAGIIRERDGRRVVDAVPV